MIVNRWHFALSHCARCPSRRHLSSDRRRLGRYSRNSLALGRPRLPTRWRSLGCFQGSSHLCASVGDLTCWDCRSECRRWNSWQLPWLFMSFFVIHWTRSPCEFGQVARSCGQWGSWWARRKQYWGAIRHGRGRSIREPKARTHIVSAKSRIDSVEFLHWVVT